MLWVKLSGQIWSQSVGIGWELYLNTAVSNLVTATLAKKANEQAESIFHTNFLAFLLLYDMV